MRANINDVNFQTKEVLLLGKGNKERTAFLTDIAAFYLSLYIQSRTDTEEALFIYKKKPFTRLSKQGVEATLKRLEHKSGVPNVHPHRYRRTLASELSAKKVPIEEIALILGHESVETTRGYISTNKSGAKYNFYNALN